MSRIWHPLSAILLDSPRAIASSGILRRLLATGKPVQALYAGDAMWPAARHGQLLQLLHLPGPLPPPGHAVVACLEGGPDLVRLAAAGPGAAIVARDADPAPPQAVPREAIVARCELAPGLLAGAARAARRRLIDLHEAMHEAPDVTAGGDGAATVRAKYEALAPFYGRAAQSGLPHQVIAWLHRHVRPGARILVAGSGAGWESFQLAREGWQVLGIDFAPAMTAAAGAQAARDGSTARFVCADLRRHEEPAASLQAVFFTYDVYSFLPRAGERIELLRRMRRWLVPGSPIFLSARQVLDGATRALLTVQWLGRLREEGQGWGGSHTRWLSSDGSIHRSFIQLFTPRGLLREIGAAGFTPHEREGGHLRLT